MKYLYLLTAVLFIGCSDKSPKVEKVITPKVEAIQSEVKSVMQTEAVVENTKEVVTQEIVTPKIATNETIVEEPKVTKNIASDVPTSCAMWSDGSNICTRVSAGKASCTTNPVENRMFSCLQWQ